jgi:hypothetical protein
VNDPFSDYNLHLFAAGYVFIIIDVPYSTASSVTIVQTQLYLNSPQEICLTNYFQIPKQVRENNIESPELLQLFFLIIIPGGFSFGLSFRQNSAVARNGLTKCSLSRGDHAYSVTTSCLGVMR